MKNLLSLLLFTALSISLYGQRSVESLFDRYSENEDFTCITISGNLLKVAKALCDDNCDDDYLPGDITTIRILAQNNEGRTAGNFYNLVQRDLDRKNYEEFMSVKKSGQDLVMLVRTSGRSFREFLIVAGGEDNLLVQIKGNMTFKEAKRFSERIKKDCGREFIDDIY